MLLEIGNFEDDIESEEYKSSQRPITFKKAERN